MNSLLVTDLKFKFNFIENLNETLILVKYSQFQFHNLKFQEVERMSEGVTERELKFSGQAKRVLVRMVCLVLFFN